MLVSPDEYDLFTSLFLCEAGKHVSTVAMTCCSSLPIPWEYCLAPPLLGFLFLAHTCCPLWALILEFHLNILLYPL